jgi:hypothetical protein
VGMERYEILCEMEGKASFVNQVIQIFSKAGNLNMHLELTNFGQFVSEEC